MARTLPLDEDVERLLKSLDPVERDVLSVTSVASARDALGEAIVREVRRRPRSVGRRAGRRRLARSGAVLVLAAGVLTAAALLPSGGSHDAQLGPTPASAAIALDRAASTALSQTAIYPTARQYEYVKVQEGVTSSGAFAGVGVRFWQSDTKQDSVQGKRLGT